MRTLNAANLLTFARLLASAPAIWAILERRFTLALVILFLAGLSDALDGPLARRSGCVTRLGAYLDPVSDKLLLSGSFLALGVVEVAPWWLVGLVFGRDLLILALVAGALLFTPIREFQPSGWGKLSTVVQVATVVTLLVAEACPWPPLGRIAWGLIWVPAATTAWSGLDYLRQAVMRLRGLAAGARG